MSRHETGSQLGLEKISATLACPDCRGPVSIGEARIQCQGCGASYEVMDGIPLFARKGSAETWGVTAPSPKTSESYQENYEGVARAQEYNEKYRRKFFKRLSTRLELRLLRRLLSTQPRCATLLDLPCGGGRLSHQLAPATDLLVEADIALGQILYGREVSRQEVPQIWMTASAFHIPFRDGGVDATVSIRLSHHLPSPEERERHLKELLRVSRRFVLMSFFDTNSVKNLLRRARRSLRLHEKSPKKTMTARRVSELARECGAELVACPHLAFFGSGHRYALMVKRGT
jgi:ubiquinone/menaquinone biosynthesis C-methylase UbiE